MELEFIILTVALFAITPICLYFGLKLVMSLGGKDIRLVTVRRKVPNHENNICQKQSTQEADCESRSERMHNCPTCVTPNYPNDDSNKSGDHNSIGNSSSHVKGIIKRLG